MSRLENVRARSGVGKQFHLISPSNKLFHRAKPTVRHEQVAIIKGMYAAGKSPMEVTWGSFFRDTFDPRKPIL